LSFRSRWLTQISVSLTSSLMSPNNHPKILMHSVQTLSWKMKSVIRGGGVILYAESYSGSCGIPLNMPCHQYICRFFS
jgi:hypothetical protein